MKTQFTMEQKFHQATRLNNVGMSVGFGYNDNEFREMKFQHHMGVAASGAVQFECTEVPSSEVGNALSAELLAAAQSFDATIAGIYARYGFTKAK